MIELNKGVQFHSTLYPSWQILKNTLAYLGPTVSDEEKKVNDNDT
jgi:hypothetical protein